MVSQTYILNKPPPPSELKRFFDQRFLPAVIDAAAGTEAVLENLAERTRRQPVPAVGLAAAIGFLLSVLARNWPKRM